jgi:hypothetical protein
LQEQYPNAIVIELHTSPAAMMLKPVGKQRFERLRKIKNWRATQAGMYDIAGQLVLAKKLILSAKVNRTRYVIEIPAAYGPPKGGVNPFFVH